MDSRNEVGNSSYESRDSASIIPSYLNQVQELTNRARVLSKELESERERTKAAEHKLNIIIKENYLSKKENKDLKEKFDQEIEENSTLSDRNRSLEDVKEEMLVELAASRSEYGILKNDLKTLRGKFKSQNADFSKKEENYEQRIELLENESDCSKEKSRTAEANLAQIKNKMKRKDTKLKQLETELQNSKDERAQIEIANKKSIEELTEQLHTKSEEESALRNELSQLETLRSEDAARLSSLMEIELLSKVEDTFLGVSGYPPPDLCPGSAERVEWLVASLTSWNAELNSRISDQESSLHEKESDKLQMEIEMEELRQHYATEYDQLMQDNADLETRVQTLMSEKKELGRANSIHREQEQIVIDQLSGYLLTSQNGRDKLYKEKLALTRSMGEMVRFFLYIYSLEMEKLMEKNRFLGESNDKLRDVLDNLKNQLTEFKKLNKKKLEDKNEEINSLTEANNFLTSELERAELSCEELKCEKRDLLGKLNRSAEECENGTKQLTKARTEVEQLKREKSDLIKAKTNFDEQLWKEQMKSNKTSQELSAKKEENANLREFQSNQTKELAAREGDIETLKRKCTDLGNRLLHFHAEKKQLKKEIENLTNKYQTLDASYKNKTKLLGERENELTKLSQSYFIASRESRSLFLRLTESTDKYEDLNRQFMRLSVDFANLSKDKAKIDQENIQLIAKLDIQKSKLEETDQLLMENNSQSSRLNKDLDESRQECERLNLILQDFEQIKLENSRLNQEREDLIGILKGLQTSVDKLGGELEERREEMNRLRVSHSEEILSLENRIESLNEDKNKTLSEFTLAKEELIEKNRALVESNAALECKLNNLDNQLHELCEIQVDSSEISIYATNGLTTKSSFAGNTNVMPCRRGFDRITALQNKMMSLHEEILRLKDSLT